MYAKADQLVSRSRRSRENDKHFAEPDVNFADLLVAIISSRIISVEQRTDPSVSNKDS